MLLEGSKQDIIETLIELFLGGMESIDIWNKWVTLSYHAKDSTRFQLKISSLHEFAQELFKALNPFLTTLFFQDSIARKEVAISERRGWIRQSVCSHVRETEIHELTWEDGLSEILGCKIDVALFSVGLF